MLRTPVPLVRIRPLKPAFPYVTAGGCGMTQPFSNPRSMIAHSMFLIETGGSIRPNVQEPSHGAGKTDP